MKPHINAAYLFGQKIHNVKMDTKKAVVSCFFCVHSSRYVTGDLYDKGKRIAILLVLVGVLLVPIS